MVKIPQELKNEYPFKSNFLPLKNINLHYVDEGQGEPVLMLHGNPTWSFFYRNLAKHFSKTNRVIVPDHIGCGLSDKPLDYQYVLENHIQNIEALVSSLNLKNITLIVHDWGGAIGLGFATRHPELIKKIVVMNTAAFRSPEIPRRINILRNPIGELVIRGFNGFAWPATFMAVEKKMPKLIKHGFTLPYHDFNSRIATAKFVRDIPRENTHPSYETLLNIEENLHLIKSPVLVLWGQRDFCFDMTFHKQWMNFFPQAKSVTFPDAGHYLVEDKTQEVISEIEQFMN